MMDFQPLENTPLQPMTEAADNYQILVENSLVGIVIVQNETIVYANESAANLLDCPVEELAGSGVYDRIHPSDTKRVQAYHILRDRGRSVPQKYDIRLLLETGNIRHLRFQSLEITYKQKPALLVNITDITKQVTSANKLKQSEERFRALVENNPDLVLVIEDNRIVKANAAASTILGYSPDELVGLTPWEISPKVQPDGATSEELRLALIERAKQGDTHSFEWTHQKKNGELVCCEVYLVWCVGGSEPYLQVIVRDITERIRIEDNRRNLEIQFEMQKRQFYRNTIYSFTNGKLEVVEQEEIAPLLAESCLSVQLERSSDLMHIRHLLGEYFKEHCLCGDVLAEFLIAAGEALTNVIVHAETGTVYAGSTDEHVWIAVVDEGEGIDSLLIPQATMGKGFSTKPSMGYGFTLMMEVADKILLTTDRSGTSLVLFKSLKQRSDLDLLNNIEFFSPPIG